MRERAAELGVSNAEVARRSGLTERRYSNYVTGIREPDLATLVRIAGVLQYTPNVLLGSENQVAAPARQLKIDRFLSAAQSLDERDFEIAVRQVELFGAVGKVQTRD